MKMMLALVLLLGARTAAAAEAQAIGQVEALRGGAVVVRGDVRQPIQIGDAIREHDVIETAADGTIAITFNDDTTVAAGPSSHLAVDQYRFDATTLKGNFLARLRRGTLSVSAGALTQKTPGAIRVETPRAVLGVRGTQFIVRVDED